MNRKIRSGIIGGLCIMMLTSSGCGRIAKKVKDNRSNSNNTSVQKESDSKVQENVTELSDNELMNLSKEEDEIQLEAVDEDQLTDLEDIDDLLSEKDPLGDIPTNFDIK